jgi:uncharacterized small protein (DUF1192 family)
MSGVVPQPGLLRAMARDRRARARNAKTPARATEHLEIAAVLEHEAMAIEQDEIMRTKAQRSSA